MGKGGRKKLLSRIISIVFTPQCSNNRLQAMSVIGNVALRFVLSLTDRVVLKLPVPFLTFCVCGRTGYLGFLNFRLYFQSILNVTF